VLKDLSGPATSKRVPPRETPAILHPERQAGTSVFVTAQDGLKLHVREYGSRSAATGLPVVCIPGLARTAADFEFLAPMLASGPPGRRVIAMDPRGRGHSEYDQNPHNYNLVVELTDLASVLIALGVGPAIFVGSSRGGLVVMLLGATNPRALAGVVLHDIGPVIEPKGLARIKTYVGKMPQPRNFDEGAYILRRLMDQQFPKLTEEEWVAAARLTWHVKNGALKLNYDPRIARTLEGLSMERPLPALWNAFDALAHLPMLVIRGAHSDLLSAETVAGMRARRREMDFVEVADEGHVPFFVRGCELLHDVARFVAKCEAVWSNPSAKTLDHHPVL